MENVLSSALFFSLLRPTTFISAVEIFATWSHLKKVGDEDMGVVGLLDVIYGGFYI